MNFQDEKYRIEQGQTVSLDYMKMISDIFDKVNELEHNNQMLSERLSLLIGQTIGQISEILNQIKSQDLSTHDIYNSLKDIWKAAGLQIHEIYYKRNKE